MSDLDSEPISWQDINAKLISPNLKNAEHILGSFIFFCSCFVIFIISMLETTSWDKRVDMLMGVGSNGEKRIMFFLAGSFLSPLLIGWPFWKLRQILIQPLLLSESEYEWIAIQKRTRRIYQSTFLIQIFTGFMMTIYAYYFFIA